MVIGEKSESEDKHEVQSHCQTHLFCQCGPAIRAFGRMLAALAALGIRRAGPLPLRQKAKEPQTVGEVQRSVDLLRSGDIAVQLQHEQRLRGHGQTVAEAHKVEKVDKADLPVWAGRDCGEERWRVNAPSNARW